MRHFFLDQHQKWGVCEMTDLSTHEYLFGLMVPKKVANLQQEVRQHLSTMYGMHLEEAPPPIVVLKTVFTLSFADASQFCETVHAMTKSGRIRGADARFCGVDYGETTPYSLRLRVGNDTFLALCRDVRRELGDPDAYGMKEAYVTLAENLSVPEWRIRSMAEDARRMLGEKQILPETISTLALYWKKHAQDALWTVSRLFKLPCCGG